MKSVVTSISLAQDSDISHARRSARLIAKVGEAPSHDQIRFATAVSEIARNALQYGREAVAEFAFDGGDRGARLVARVQDRGGGIADIDTLLGSGHTVQSGVGHGLSGSRRLVDDFVVDTSEAGTVIDLIIELKTATPPSDLAQSAADVLVEASHGSAVEELSEQNRALRDALAQQQFLLREMHHRTKNNLAIIQSLALMQARQSESEETRAALELLTGRIQAFASAHNLLHRGENVAEVDMRQHIETLAGRLRAALDQSGIEIETTSDKLYVSFDTATEIGLIVNELLTNAAKYVAGDYTTRHVVKVDVVREGSGIRLTVSDDGPGIENAEATLHKSRSLGWRIVESCVRKLNGSIEVDGTNGLSVSIFFRDQTPQ
ncbi:sensor histidine kinase [Pararhizobium mangrovi]|uniref:histidine kinase n=1 Tax=Pararhizobium mangrovi TaxID=2590452 RepID=A0A506U0T9_9HYPH|nr:histidine kinase dimerization/phosphoacceptor domain -containing protein [Pararhizobium mangrovi]TPW27962.1 hypothetical protein FJU11_10490 [Pararhizobium mangrovi]